MTVKAVQNDNSRGNVFASVMKATVTGGVTGYIAKQVIPLTTEELKDIPYRAIINASRKDTNKNMVAKLKGLEERTPAHDTFIKMIDEKNFKNAGKSKEKEQYQPTQEELDEIAAAYYEDLANEQQTAI